MAVQDYFVGQPPLGSGLVVAAKLLENRDQQQQENKLMQAWRKSQMDGQARDQEAATAKANVEKAYADISEAELLPPEMQAAWFDAQKKQYPELAASPKAQLPPAEFIKVTKAGLAAQLGRSQQGDQTPTELQIAKARGVDISNPQAVDAFYRAQDAEKARRAAAGATQINMPGQVELGKPTRGNLEDVFVKGQGNAMALQQQLARYRKEFSTYGGQIKAAMGTGAEKMGMRVDPTTQQYVSDYNSWKSDTTSLLSAYLNQLSGAAISPTEEARLRSSFPNESDGPTEYMSKAKTTMQRFALAQARAAYLLSNPTLTMDSVSLEKMQGIIVNEANALAKSYESGGTDPARARAEALNTVRAKYGMSNGQ
jgi:hypothetical protein